MKTITLYETGSHASNACDYAQRQLSGRTHYVDRDTLRFHKSRILSARGTDQGLLFALVESVALDPDNRRRGYRYIIFDLFGTVVGTRVRLDDAFKTAARATKAMWTELESLDAKALTLAAIEREEKYAADEFARLRSKLGALNTATPKAA